MIVLKGIRVRIRSASDRTRDPDAVQANSSNLGTEKMDRFSMVLFLDGNSELRCTRNIVYLMCLMQIFRSGA